MVQKITNYLAQGGIKNQLTLKKPKCMHLICPILFLKAVYFGHQIGLQSLYLQKNVDILENNLKFFELTNYFANKIL